MSLRELRRIGEKPSRLPARSLSAVAEELFIGLGGEATTRLLPLLLTALALLGRSGILCLECAETISCS